MEAEEGWQAPLLAEGRTYRREGLGEVLLNLVPAIAEVVGGGFG